MKINRVILSSNESAKYLDFWPIVSKSWERFGIKPTLFFTGKEKYIDKNVINLNLENVNTAFLAQNIRLLAPALFPEETCLISDIDNMPLSEDYFTKSILNVSEDKFVIYRPDAVPNNMISIMWNAAKGSVWSEIFNVYNLEDIKNTLQSWYPTEYSVNGKNWYHDQIILKKYVETFEQKNPERVLKLSDKETGFRRLDRSNYTNTLKSIYQNQNFSDFHMPRPYSKNKLLINLIYYNFHSERLKFLYKFTLLLYLSFKRFIKNLK